MTAFYLRLLIATSLPLMIAFGAILEALFQPPPPGLSDRDPPKW